MTIPFDHLYHWLEAHYPEPGITYAFDPPGSRELQNLDYISEYHDTDRELYPEVICHDQEPLNFDLYKFLEPDQLKQLRGVDDVSVEFMQTLNLRAALLKCSLYDKVILIHSEKNSKDLDLYAQHGFIGVHYWAHAVIARDWFRFAGHDVRLDQSVRSKNKKRFLVYLRDWTGSREYRLAFAKMVVDAELIQNCIISIKHQADSGQAAQDYKFKNPALSPDNFEFLDSLENNVYSSCASADYNYQDFVNSSISVVLETVFDSSKIHLTEKILRPIACGHPFLLAAGSGSLEYLRSYGFKTFAPWIDESYDTETDSLKRLQLITAEMIRLQNMSADQFEQVGQQLSKIANFNKQRFFSKDFFDQVSVELKTNLKTAFDQVKLTRGKLFLNRIKPVVYNNPAKLRQKLLKLRALRKTSK